MTGLILTALLVLLVAGALLAALYHQPRQETTMPFPPDPKCLGAATAGAPAPVATPVAVTLADNLTIGSGIPAAGFRCQRCGQSLLHSQAQAGHPVRGFWVTMENGRLGFDCPAGPGGHVPHAPPLADHRASLPPETGALEADRPGSGWLRRFYLERDVDVSGISGTGVVAEGVAFSDGTAVIHWTAGEHHSTVVWPDVAGVEAIHGHAGATRIVWVDVACRVCGCTDDEACFPSCHWVEPDLCSACVRGTQP